MSNPSELSAQRVSAAAALRSNHGHRGRSLTIAVLGPALTHSSGGTIDKRSQIFQFLESVGHKPFYPETRINIDNRWVFGEVDLLSSTDVDLVIVLQTERSEGVKTEIGAFAVTPAIRVKTAILTPKEYYTPDSSFLANTADVFPVKVPYTRRHFEECCLLEDCKEIVENHLTSEMPSIQQLDL